MSSGGPKTMSTLTGQQKQLMSDLSYFVSPGSIDPRYRSQVGQDVAGSKIGQPAQAYGGTIIPNLLSPFQDLLGQLPSLKGTTNQFQVGQMGAINQALSGKPSFNLDPKVTNNYFNDSVKSPMLRTFDQEIAPRIRESYGGFGGFSSREGNATATQLGNLQADLTAQRSSLAYQDQGLAAQLSESAANRQMQGVTLGNQMNQLPLQNAAMLQQLYAPYQQRIDLQHMTAYEQFLRTQPENSPWTNLALGLVGQQTQSAYNPTVNPYLKMGVGALGGAASGAMMGSVVPGIGTGIGALVGGIAGLAGGF